MKFINHNSQDIAPLKILIIEDDEAIGRSLVKALEWHGLQVTWTSTGREGLARKPDFMPDIVLVDLNLPDIEGMALVRVLVEHDDCGVIIVSGLTDDADRIVGLEIGAADYISKPPHLRELLARIRAVHRRFKVRASVKINPEIQLIVHLGKLRIDLKGRSVHAVDGTRIALTGAEFTALDTMIAANGLAVSRDDLSKAALRRASHAEDRCVDQLIFSLRQKLGGGDKQQIIHSIRGAGYMVSASTTASGYSEDVADAANIAVNFSPAMLPPIALANISQN